MREEHFSNIDSRRSERVQHHSGGWAVGLVLILAGVLIFLGDFGGITLQNWWALFILIPAFGAFGRAWSAFQSSGRLDSRVRGGLIGGVFFTAITLFILLGVNWFLFWPAILIIIGVSMLLNGVLPD